MNYEAYPLRKNAESNKPSLYETGITAVAGVFGAGAGVLMADLVIGPIFDNGETAPRDSQILKMAAEYVVILAGSISFMALQKLRSQTQR
jgi:hypothetical protein